ncbi:hypothetical protein [Weissella muntiaci]|jgi:hypothetical protein|nr:hypothetical protein [Weissella muntiaci]
MEKDGKKHTGIKIAMVVAGLLLSSETVRQKIIDQYDHMRTKKPTKRTK